MDKSPDAFRTISEVAEVLDTPAHVLRFWESRFPQVRPIKRAGGRRYYRPSDIALLGGIKRLLHEDGLSIRGVQTLLREQGVRHVAGLVGPPVEDEDTLAVALPPPPAPARVLAFPPQRSGEAGPEQPLKVPDEVAEGAEPEPAEQAAAMAAPGGEAGVSHAMDEDDGKAQADPGQAPPQDDREPGARPAPPDAAAPLDELPLFAGLAGSPAPPVPVADAPAEPAAPEPATQGLAARLRALTPQQAALLRPQLVPLHGRLAAFVAGLVPGDGRG